MQKVAIVGIGATKLNPTSGDLSYREMIYEAATKAYSDASIEAKDVQSFVCCTEDFNEGTSISDEYAPDQLGAVLKPVQTIPGDGIQGLATGFMQIASGLFEIVVIEAHSKASNILYHDEILKFAFDPIYNREISKNPLFLAGLEMNRFLYVSKNTKEQCAEVVVRNKRNALDNPLAGYSANIKLEDVLNSPEVAYPLSKLDISETSDGAVVIVIAGEKIAKKLNKKPVWIRGISWYSDTPTLELREMGEANYAKISAVKAYKMAGIKNPQKEIDFAEVDDTYSYKELQHLEATGLARKGRAGKLLQEGYFDRDGEIPVNISGGSLGCGDILEANGLYKVYELCLQLRGEAGKRQIKKISCGLAQSWRGIPTATGGIVILGR